MVAKWPDGMEWVVEAISVQEWQSTTGRRGKVDRLWEGVRASTHHDSIKIRVDLFGTLPLPQPAVTVKNHPALVGALKMMVPLAEGYPMYHNLSSGFVKLPC